MIFFESNDLYTGKIDCDSLTKAAEAALKHQSAPENSELTIAIEDSEKLHELNTQFLGIDAPTDVLSFAAHETDPETNALYLGDIIISLPIAEAQAASSGHALIAELQLLVVHGTLHLLGHDHATPDQKNEMWAAQKEILESIHCLLAKFPE